MAPLGNGMEKVIMDTCFRTGNGNCMIFKGTRIGYLLNCGMVFKQNEKDPVIEKCSGTRIGNCMKFRMDC